MNAKLNENSDLFHADASTRLQLLNKWENKFVKSQLMSEEKSPVQKNKIDDSYEWDRDDDLDCSNHMRH
jgi:hypothetical protein